MPATLSGLFCLTSLASSKSCFSVNNCPFTLEWSLSADFLSTDDDQTQTEASKRYIKVLQKLLAGAHTCEHQVSVLLNLTLKDTKNVSVLPTDVLN